MKKNTSSSDERQTNNISSRITDFCSSEQEKQKRRKQVLIITSHLASRFRINASDTQLVLVLCNGLKNNNFEALISWVDCRIDIIDFGDYQEWESALEIFLSDIYQ
jgi:ABC-type lipoprotein release transport system permease subunit